MKKLFVMLALMLLAAFNTQVAQAYDNEVYTSGGTYRWKTANVERGSTADLATAITNCIWQSTGAGREIHLLVGGSLASTLGLPGDVKVFGHSNTYTVTHGGYGIYAKKVSNVSVQDMTLTGATNMVFRMTACDNVTLSGININGGFIGMRIDSRDSRPWEATSYNLRVTNCRFENLGSHGLETYGIDGVYVDNIVARNNGECGVLFNNSRNGYVGTIDAYRCSYNGGYAGLRFANDNWNFRVKYLKAVECGRGFFTTTNATNIIVEEVYIRDCTAQAILIQYGDGVGVNSGTYNGGINNHYTSANCWILATDINGVTATPPAAPTSIGATPSSSRVSLSWPAVAGATSYLVQRSTTSGDRYYTIANTDTTSYADRDLTPNTTYYYVVRAVNAAGPSPISPQATAAVSTFTPVVDTALGLQRHYPFNGSNVDSKGGPAAVIASTPTYVPGMLNQALSLDGSTNYATLPSMTAADYREFTVATWLWPGSDANWQRVFDFGSGTSNYMMMTRINGTLRFDLSRNGSVQSTFTTAPVLDRWVHIAVTFSGSWATIYLNGVAQRPVLFANNPAQIALTQNYIGKSQFPDPLLKGRVDDFRLYNRGLSAAEVSSLVMNAPALPPFNLIAGGFGNKVNMSWTGVENATSYNVKRATVSGGPYTTVASGLTGTTYSDTSVQANKTYYYVVTGSNPQGESSPSNEDAAVTSDLALHLKFNETTGTVATDSSGNGWDASLVNGPTWGAGKLQNALQLPDTAGQHATLPTGVVSGLNDFTIATWVKVGTFSTFSRIFDFGTGTTSYMMLTPQYATDANAAKMRFSITNSGAGGEQQIDSSTAMPVNTWVHVAVTLGGNTGRLYLNGTLVGTNTNITVKPSAFGFSKQNYLGRSQFADPNLNGALDDFRIYSRALNGTEVSDLANPIATPTNLSATPANGQATLAWSAASGATSYNLKRATTTGGPYSNIANLTSTTYTNTGLTPGTTYYYVVSGRNSIEESANSNEASATVPTQLLAHLPFDATSGTTATDATGHGWNGTLVNGATWSSGRLSNAVSLSGTNQYVSLPAGVVNGLTDFSISAWVNLNGVTTWSRVFDFGSGTGSYMFLTPRSNTGAIRFAIKTATGSEQMINGTAALPPTEWHHIAITLKGSVGTLYIDGAVAGTNNAMTFTPSSLGSTTQNWIGRSQFAPDPYLNGKVDDFRIYSRALTVEELSSFANQSIQQSATSSRVSSLNKARVPSQKAN